jgi:nucleoside-diphosphate-sugar epimerase
MRVLVLGGTRFLGRRIVERLHARQDEVLVVHRGVSRPENWIAVRHLLTDRLSLADHRREIAKFAPDAVIDTIALTGAAMSRP